MTIERALYEAYGVKRVDADDPIWTMDARLSASGSDVFNTLRVYGVPIDTSPKIERAEPDDPDMAMIHAVVRTLARSIGLIVIMHARSLSRPDWMSDAVAEHFVPERKPSGGLKFVRCDRNHRPIACRIERVGVPKQTIRVRRQAYREWAEAIHRLHSTLCFTLKQIELTSHLPDLEPWKKKSLPFAQIV